MLRSSLFFTFPIIPTCTLLYCLPHGNIICAMINRYIVVALYTYNRWWRRAQQVHCAWGTYAAGIHRRVAITISRYSYTFRWVLPLYNNNIVHYACVCVGKGESILNGDFGVVTPAESAICSTAYIFPGWTTFDFQNIFRILIYIGRLHARFAFFFSVSFTAFYTVTIILRQTVIPRVAYGELFFVSRKLPTKYNITVCCIEVS